MTALVADGAVPATEREASGGIYSWYVVLLLGIGQIIGGIDRNLVAILAEPVRREFHLSDSQVGLLTGLAFAISFAIMGLPLGLLIDRVHRGRLYSCILAVWSLLTMVSGLAGSFAHLVIARIGVGAAEAGAAPAAMSLLTDYFPPHRRATAIGWFFFSTPLGVAIGFGVGGVIAGHLDWRSAFFIAGVPGLVTSLIILLTLREPRRGGFDPSVTPQAARGATVKSGAAMAQAFGTIWRVRPMICIASAIGILLAAHSGLTVFLASYLVRVEGMTLPQAGGIIALGLGLGGAIGMPFGGMLADRLDLRRPGLSLEFAALTMIGAPVTMAAMLLVGGGFWWFAGCLTIYAFWNAAYYGAAFGKYMGLAPASIRGTCSAILFIISNLAGYGFGPQITGLLSDAASALHFAVPLRVAMLGSSLLFLPACILFLLAAKGIRRMAAEAA